MVIIGAGISGLLAGQYFRHLNPTIIEVQDSLPNNHSALLRFRSRGVSDLTGIPFKKVTVRKGIAWNSQIHKESFIAASNLYSMKVHDALQRTSIDDISTVERYIAPHNFIELAARGLDIRYGEAFDPEKVHPEVPIISTIPMEKMCEALEMEYYPELKAKTIWTFNAPLLGMSDIHQTIYYPLGDDPMYRLSITGRQVTAEFVEDIGTFARKHIEKALKAHFGIDMTMGAVRYEEKQYGKLIEYQGDFVKNMIQTLTQEHGIYSLGRWATHRQILSDDVVNDIQVIDRMIRSEGYNR